jgi:hypothetical protein
LRILAQRDRVIAPGTHNIGPLKIIVSFASPYRADVDSKKSLLQGTA